MIEIFKNLDLQNLENETWKTIKDFPDYQVSNLGRIKSLKFGKERILKQRKNNKGYFRVDLYKNGEKENKLIHRLVFEIHIKKLEDGYDAHHIDFNPENNDMNNFIKMTKSEHRKIHMIGINHSKEKNPMFGKQHSEKTKKKMSETRKGENNSNFKLTNQKIIDIQSDIEKGNLSQRKIAKKHGVCRMTISNIKTGKLLTFNQILKNENCLKLLLERCLVLVK